MRFNRLIPELLVSDVSRSRAFYIDLLGFTLCYDRPEEGFAFLEREGAQIMLEQFVPENRFITMAPEAPYGRGISFQIETKDVDALHDAIVKADWPLFLPMEEKWYGCGDVEGGNRQFLLQDPDGYLLRFYQDLGQRP